MISINERIRLILDRQGIANKDVAEWLGMTNSRLSQKFKAGIWDSVDELKVIAKHTGMSLDSLITGVGFDSDIVPKVEEPTIPVGKGMSAKVADIGMDYLSGKVIRPIMVTVDRSGRELITYVPVKAQAGYARGYSDEKYIEKLPAFTLPNFADNGTFRMFQVAGDSMRQLGGGGLQDGDVVIGAYVEDFFTMKDNMVYVIVSTDGIVIKRIINRLSTSDKMIVLKSDNKNGDYPNVILHANKIVEVWEYKAHISRQLNFATDLYDMINEMQVQHAKLSERVDDIDSKTRMIKK